MFDDSPVERLKRKIKWFAKDSLCKGCQKNQKRHGSRYCQECSDKFKNKS